MEFIGSSDLVALAIYTGESTGVAGDKGVVFVESSLCSIGEPWEDVSVADLCISVFVDLVLSSFEVDFGDIFFESSEHCDCGAGD